MDFLKEMQSFQPPFYMNVLEMQEILKADAKQLYKDEVAQKSVVNNAFIQTLDSYGCERWEKILQIEYNSSRTLEERKALIVSLLKGFQKLSATRIKEIAQSYQNGEVDVKFENSTIKITYISLVGIPSTFTDFQNVIEKLKPAHLQLEFDFKYNTHKVLSQFTHNKLSNYTHKQLNDTKIV